MNNYYTKVFNVVRNMELFNYNYKYLTDQHLLGFEHYKYSSIDTSPLSLYVMHPFWNNIVQYFPKWMAPNLLTFVGFMFTVLNLVLFSWYDYSFYASSEAHAEILPIPRWVFFIAAFNIFMAYTLDGIDGKQARRLRLSSPVGELFDHGLDSYTAVMIPVSLFSVFGRDGTNSVNTLRMFLVCWNVFITFYVSHWEKYNTGILYLPWGYDFSMWGSTLLFLLTGIFGHTFWKFSLATWSGGACFEVLLHVSSMANTPMAFYNIYRSYKYQTGKMRSFSEAVRPLVSIVYCFALMFTWVTMSPSGIIERDPRALFILTGTIFSNICCHLIISQMSNTRCELLNWLLVPTTAAIVLILTLIPRLAIFEIALLYALCVYACLSHIHYGACVVRQMCQHFKIDCFHVKQTDDKD